MDQYVMIQFFEWYLPADGGHWERLQNAVPDLAALGVSGIWIPPCYKGTGPEDTGYGVYDLYDLGEFDQKNTVPTKYGTRRQLENAIDAAHRQGLKIYADVVLNHKAGADETETVRVVQVDDEDRGRAVSDPHDMKAWTKFTFPGRHGTYSDFQWNKYHFTGTDYNASTGERGIYRFLGDGKDWSDDVDPEFGNYDYLMFTDVDFDHPDVVRETLSWGRWLIRTLRLDGMRLDAVKHISDTFLQSFVMAMRKEAGPEFYVVGEYWRGDTEILRHYLSDVDYHMDLFDVRLHFHFHDISRNGSGFDLRTVFDDTLVASNPQNVVTFVDNHDSQPGQSMESWVEDWFKPAAYALILLREDGYPCVFYADYYGSGGPRPFDGMRGMLDSLLRARKQYAYGTQTDVFDAPDRIAWTRAGDAEHPGSGLAVVISTGEESAQSLSFGSGEAGQEWRDLTGSRTETVTLDDGGTGTFPVSAGSVSVWVRAQVL